MESSTQERHQRCWELEARIEHLLEHVTYLPWTETAPVYAEIGRLRREVTALRKGSVND